MRPRKIKFPTAANSEARSNKIWEGFVAGLVGGAIGSWTMARFAVARNSAAKRHPDPKEEVNGKIATIIMTRLRGKRLAPQHSKRRAADAVHFAFGSIVGGVYGAITAVMPNAGIGHGAGFGALLWLVNDELILRIFDLGSVADQLPLDEHLDQFAAHVVYAVTTDVSIRAIRSTR